MATEANDTVSNTPPDRVDHSEKTLSEPDAAPQNPSIESGETKPNPNSFRRKLASARRVFSDRLIKSFHGDDFATRLYHVWPGNNVFLFGGRLVCGPDPRGLVLTAMAILMSSWSFAVYVANDDVSADHGAKIICAVILTFIVVVNLGLVSMTDPGIVPRDDTPLTEDRRRVDVEGVDPGLEYCGICNVYRPPRTRHCVVCDNCVERFDHHCPWIGQCIGLRNYKLYIMFLTMALVFFTYIFAFSFQKIQRRMTQNDVALIELFRNYPETLALASFAFTASWLLGGLTCYNLYLVALNQTSYENIHREYASSRNPYDGGFWSNVVEVLCGARPKPKVDFRAKVIRHGNSCSWIIHDQV